MIVNDSNVGFAKYNVLNKVLEIILCQEELVNKHQ